MSRVFADERARDRTRKTHRWKTATEKPYRRRGKGGEMNIKMTRHARRRAKLYHIPEHTIMSLIEKSEMKPGKHEIIKHIDEFPFPLKIVFEVESDEVTVITNYLYKKGRNK
ncbi:MAG: hypothetical protein HYZ34_15630 [Ignavibacteriae bacterium]|nr:hypothetical protein [Ignavibacteriota bacterium]